MQYESVQGYATGVWACGTIAAERHSVTAIRVFFVAPRFIAYRPALGRIVDAPGRLRVCFEPALSWLGHLLGLAKRIKAAPPAASTQPSARTKRQPRQNGLPGTSHGAPPSRGGPPRGHRARRLPSMHEIPGLDLGRTWAARVQRHLGCETRLRCVSST